MLMDDLDYENRSSKIYGVVTAIVTNNKDPEKMGRVKVTYPWLAEEDESHWARIATMMAGNDRGTYFIPEIEDEVLVAFEHGDIHYPYIIGALWNGKDKVHENNDDGENNLRVIKSRSGHKIIFDDKNGSEKVTIIDKSEQMTIVLDSKSKNIDISNKNGKINIVASDDINIESDKNVNIKTGQNFIVSAGSNAEVKANSSVNVKASSSGTFEANASLTLKSGGVNTIKGAIVKLN